MTCWPSFMSLFLCVYSFFLLLTALWFPYYYFSVVWLSNNNLCFLVLLRGCWSYWIFEFIVLMKLGRIRRVFFFFFLMSFLLLYSFWDTVRLILDSVMLLSSSLPHLILTHSSLSCGSFPPTPPPSFLTVFNFGFFSPAVSSSSLSLSFQIH